jgi:energy-coupling factor transporter transmembrane protein EcfT
MIAQRRWIWLVGFILVIISIFVPEHSVIHWVLLIAGFAVIIVQVPVAMATKRKRHASSSAAAEDDPADSP